MLHLKYFHIKSCYYMNKLLFVSKQLLLHHLLQNGLFHTIKTNFNATRNHQHPRISIRFSHFIKEIQ